MAVMKLGLVEQVTHLALLQVKVIMVVVEVLVSLPARSTQSIVSEASEA